MTETWATRQWAEGERDIGSTEREQRLRATAQGTRLISETVDAHTAQAWMQGMDPMLDDRSPAWVLRHATTESAQRCLAACETSANLPDLTPIGPAYGASLDADDALERAMNFHNLSWEL